MSLKYSSDILVTDGNFGDCFLVLLQKIYSPLSIGNYLTGEKSKKIFKYITEIIGKQEYVTNDKKFKKEFQIPISGPSKQSFSINVMERLESEIFKNKKRLDELLDNEIKKALNANKLSLTQKQTLETLSKEIPQKMDLLEQFTQIEKEEPKMLGFEDDDLCTEIQIPTQNLYSPKKVERFQRNEEFDQKIQQFKENPMKKLKTDNEEASFYSIHFLNQFGKIISLADEVGFISAKDCQQKFGKMLDELSKFELKDPIQEFVHFENVLNETNQKLIKIMDLVQNLQKCVSETKNGFVESVEKAKSEPPEIYSRFKK